MHRQGRWRHSWQSWITMYPSYRQTEGSRGCRSLPWYANHKTVVAAVGNEMLVCVEVCPSANVE